MTRWHLPSIGALVMVITAVALGAQGTPTPADPPTPDQATQTPTFRVGTDLLTVDVSVVDSSGKPIEGLTPADFTIKIDGKVRKVMAAEVSKPDTDAVGSLRPGQPGATITQTEAARPRHILFVVDQLYIPTGSIKPLMISASKFLDQLAPRDEVGFLAFPVGPHVDFTTDKAKVRDVMTGMIGMPSIDRLGQLVINIGEARTVNDRERYQMADQFQFTPPDEKTPVLLRLYERNCNLDAAANNNERVTCIQQILSQSSEIALRSRSDAKASVSTLESIVKQMTPIEGSKSMILVSAAMAINETRDVDELLRLAKLARTSFNVLIIDPPEENKDIGRNAPNHTRAQANTELDDRRIRVEGLEQIAAEGGGAVYRIAGTGEGVFTRLATELSASYVLGLESLPDDLGKGARKVEVTVKRPGARIRTAQAYVSAPSAAASAASGKRIDPVLREALEASSERTEVPLRVAAFKRWDTASDKIRVNLTASVGPPGARADDFTIGYVVLDKQNKTVASATQKPVAAADGQPAPFGAAVLLEPGVYSLRLSVVNGEGRRSTVIRELNASRTAVDDLATSDLVVGEAQGQGLTPSPEPHVKSGKLAAYLELYSDKAEDLDWTFVHIDVAKDEKGEALATEEADVANGPRPSWRVASGTVPLNGLAPGPYVARARIVRDDKVIRTLTSPFVIDAPK